jgi:hypothetical protein
MAPDDGPVHRLHNESPAHRSPPGGVGNEKPSVYPNPGPEQVGNRHKIAKTGLSNSDRHVRFDDAVT